MKNRLFGAVEAGGTKFVCLVGTSPEDIVAEVRIPTTNPEETLGRVVDFFRPYHARGEIAAIGIGSFGPLDLDPRSSTYGFITSTPKVGWRMVDFLRPFREALAVPLSFDTDVNAAAYGEQYWISENRRVDPFLYVTVGTGIGVGAIVNGAAIHGMTHTEAGHLLLPHDEKQDDFAGVCPFHGDCWEGLASGPAIAQRWGTPAEDLPMDHPAWDLEADYIARAFVNLMFAYSPRKIVLGGGVGRHDGLLVAVRAKLLKVLNGYISLPSFLDHVDEIVVAPGLGSRSGVLGALALGMKLVSG
jgi:fructokinase